MRSLLTIGTLLLATALSAETYIIPMYGVVPGTPWYTNVTATNPHGQPVTLRFVDSYPMVTDRCVHCPEVPVQTIPPKSMRLVVPFHSNGLEFTVTGAYVVETSAPLRFDVMYFTFNEREIRQRIDVARDWLPAGEHVASVQSGHDARLNALVVNPNDFAIEVSVWREPRGENEVRIAVPPHATRMVRLPGRLCGGAPCPGGGVYPPAPELIHFDSPARFLGGVSAIGPSWAFFSLAGDAD